MRYSRVMLATLEQNPLWQLQTLYHTFPTRETIFIDICNLVIDGIEEKGGKAARGGIAEGGS